MPSADPRFFARSGPFPLAQVAKAATGGAAAAWPGSDSALVLSGIAPLQLAGPGDVSFLDNRKYAPALRETRAGAVIVNAEMAASVPAGSLAIVTDNPYLGWARVAALFHPPPPVVAGSHPSAVIAADAVIDASAEIGPLAVIESGAVIGPRCRIGAHAVIGAKVVLGTDCRIGPHATLSHAILGDRVYIYPGARIGQEGFGFAITPSGFVSVPQLGLVRIGDDVEVGANSTVDRGSLQDTVIGAGSRLDNLVQIAHNVRLGRACVIAAQAGIAGSVTLEDCVMIGGQAGIIGHLHIGARARLGAQSGVIADVPAGADMLGSPGQPARDCFRQLATLRKLSGTGKKVAGRKAASETD